MSSMYGNSDGTLLRGRSVGGTRQRCVSMTASSMPIGSDFVDKVQGWKLKRNSTITSRMPSAAVDLGFKIWNGRQRTCFPWDNLRKDPELWFADGTCLVHLFEYGQSRRGPTFRLPIDALFAARCHPLLDRFTCQSYPESPTSDCSSGFESGSNFFPTGARKHELFIPAPQDIARTEAFHYHSATRNLFAWVFGKPLVGSHLGGALVGLLNSMNEFRSAGEDNIEAIMDYMDEEGYADMRNSPDHALAILFFAEHFQFKDLYIDAFAHCTGMHDRLPSSPGFEFMSRTSRALITRSRYEMEMRLDYAGQRLSSFLSDDLDDAHLGLSAPARNHLEKFRSFLHSYYVAQLGYYPPTTHDSVHPSFPKEIYAHMLAEFTKLHDYLVDNQFTQLSTIPPKAQQGGICVLQSLQAFDNRHKYTPRPHQLPLLPECEDEVLSQTSLRRRMSWLSKSDKLKPDPKVVTLSAIIKATNRSEGLDCGLVRAYRTFEKECIMPSSTAEKPEKLSPANARKVRWILIYTILQVLTSVTKVPQQVRDTQNLPYNLCVETAGCLPWKESRPIESLIRTQTHQAKEDFALALAKAAKPQYEVTLTELKPDVDYHAIQNRAKLSHDCFSSRILKRGTVTRARSMLGNMPELSHPSPRRPVYHEILVHGYGNGTIVAKINPPVEAPVLANPPTEHISKQMMSSSPSSEGVSSRWSTSSIDAADLSSPSRRGSTVSNSSIRDFVGECLPPRPSSSVYSASVYDEDSDLQPEPLRLKSDPDELMNRELREYLST